MSEASSSHPPIDERPPILTLSRRGGHFEALAGAFHKADVHISTEDGTVSLVFPLRQVAFTTAEIEMERTRLKHEASELTAGFMILEGKRNQEIAELRAALEACQPAKPVVLLDVIDQASPSLDELRIAIARLKAKVVGFGILVDDGETPIAAADEPVVALA